MQGHQFSKYHQLSLLQPVVIEKLKRGRLVDLRDWQGNIYKEYEPILELQEKMAAELEKHT